MTDHSTEPRRVFCAGCHRERIGAEWVERLELPDLAVEPVSHGACPECLTGAWADLAEEEPLMEAIRERRGVA
jgi:hypothetical protein